MLTNEKIVKLNKICIKIFVLKHWIKKLKISKNFFNIYQIINKNSNFKQIFVGV